MPPACGSISSICGAVQHAQALQPVLLAALVEGAQALQFGFIHRHDQLAADFVGDAVVAAEGGHFLDAGDGQTGLERAGLVIKAGMEHAAVVAGLMAADVGLFFQNDDARPGSGRRT